MAPRQVRISEQNYLRVAELAGAENRTIRQQLDVILNSALAEREKGHQEVGARVSARQDTPLASPRRRSAGSPTASLVVSRSASPDEDDHFHPDPKPGKKEKK